MKQRAYVSKTNLDQSPVWKHKRPLLSWLDMELTERCNNDCIHCCINLPANDLTTKERELTTKEIEGILQEAASLGCLTVRFTGGEPLLREDFEEIYLFARQLGLKVLLFTNATLITTHVAELFARVPPLEKIEVSVYGMRKASYEAVTRVPGSFEAAWGGINRLLKKKVPFVVKSALVPPNRHEMDEFEAWAKTIPWMDMPPSYSMFFDLRNRRDNLDKNTFIASLRVTPREGLAVLTRDAEKYRKEMQEFATKFMGTPGGLLFSCGAGKGLCIDAYGRAQPCMGVRAPELTVDVLGTVGNPLQAALKRFSRLHEMRATNPDYLKRCAVCFLKGLCEQCPAKSWAENGTFDTPVEYLCDVAHAQARWLGWLGSNEYGWERVPQEKYAERKERNRANL